MPPVQPPTGGTRGNRARSRVFLTSRRHLRLSSDSIHPVLTMTTICLNLVAGRSRKTHQLCPPHVSRVFAL
jgi:hypothetical protein